MPNNSIETKKEAFERLCGIMDRLRAECPWDIKQTNESLRTLTIEETHELADAILNNDPENIKEELGDVLLHILFYSKIGDEKSQFDIADVCHKVSEKLIFRHPHIYGDVKVKDEEEVKQNWEKLKMKEGKKSILEGVPTSLPSMVKAIRIQEKTAKVGFEWENKEQVWAKVEEEIGELREAIDENFDHSKIEEEFGDVLFSLINYARFIKVDPDTALEKINRKFKSRFEYIESNATRPLEEMTLEEMDELWNEAKRV
jgi:XTP/dITP diphosphohydrolase